MKNLQTFWYAIDKSIDRYAPWFIVGGLFYFVAHVALWAWATHR